MRGPLSAPQQPVPSVAASKVDKQEPNLRFYDPISQRESSYPRELEISVICVSPDNYQPFDLRFGSVVDNIDLVFAHHQRYFPQHPPGRPALANRQNDATPRNCLKSAAYSFAYNTPKLRLWCQTFGSMSNVEWGTNWNLHPKDPTKVLCSDVKTLAKLFMK